MGAPAPGVSLLAAEEGEEGGGEELPHVLPRVPGGGDGGAHQVLAVRVVLVIVVAPLAVVVVVVRALRLVGQTRPTWPSHFEKPSTWLVLGFSNTTTKTAILCR